MLIKKLDVKNYRCFPKQSFEFHLPNGVEGSGLNIFVGENSNGKTSILEAIRLLTQSRLSTRATISVRDFNDIKKELVVGADTVKFSVSQVYGKGKFDCIGFQFKAKAREQGGAELLDPIVFDNVVIPEEEGKAAYELRQDVTKPWGVSRLPKFNIVYLDKNRSRHISKGTFPAKFDDLIKDFNFQLLEKLTTLDETDPTQGKERDLLLSINEKVKKILYSKVNDKLLGDVLKECGDYFDHRIDLDVFNNWEPFNGAFFASEKGHSNQQIPISKLGSGVEEIFSIIFLYNYYLKKGEKIIFLIDEPELHLHPVWQSKVASLLMMISKDSQVFVSTHSPYLIKRFISVNTGIFSLKASENNIVVEEMTKATGLFPWSPSWGEVNFNAYNLPSIEFHNELYGYIQESFSVYLEAEMETYLGSKGIPITKSYSRQNKDGTVGIPYLVTICTYIRNQIHHPENTNNVKFTEQELRESIELLVGVI